MTTFENRYVSKTYIIVLRFIFNPTYNQKKRFKNTCELYITNWSYSYKVVIFFRFIPENEIEGEILGWTPSTSSCKCICNGAKTAVITHPPKLWSLHVFLVLRNWICCYSSSILKLKQWRSFLCAVISKRISSFELLQAMRKFFHLTHVKDPYWFAEVK